MTAPVNYQEYGPLYAGWARFISLLAALVLSALLLLTRHQPWLDFPVLDRLLLILAFWGTAAGYVHGIGYVPLNRFWRGFFSPYVGWPALLGGILWWIS